MKRLAVLWACVFSLMAISRPAGGADALAKDAIAPVKAADARAVPVARGKPDVKPAAKVTARPWVAMDYGPVMSLTLEAPLPEPAITPKGIMIRLTPRGNDPENTACVLFDADLLRLSAAWSGGMINWKNVLYDGTHRTWAGIAGEQAFGTKMMPGWAEPATGKFEDPRPRFASTDYAPQPEHWRNRAYGPLPEAYAKYRGFFMNGERVVLSYAVGQAGVLESYALEGGADARVFARTLNIGKSDRDLTLLVMESAEKGGRVMAIDKVGAGDGAGGTQNENGDARGTAVIIGGASGEAKAIAPPAVPQNAPGAAVKELPSRGLVAAWSFDEKEGNSAAASDGSFNAELSGGAFGPGRKGNAISFKEGQHALVKNAKGVDLSADFSVTGWIKTSAGGTVFSKAPAGKWVAGGKTLFVENGMLTFDVGWVGGVRGKVNVGDGNWHHVALTYRKQGGAAALFVDGKPAGAGSLASRADPEQSQIRMGVTSNDFPRGDGNKLAGALDEVRLYSRALEAAEIAALAGDGVDAPAAPKLTEAVVVMAVGAPEGAKWLIVEGGQLRLQIPATATPTRMKILMAKLPVARLASLAAVAGKSAPAEDLETLTHGGPARWPEVLTTQGIVAGIGTTQGAIAKPTALPPSGKQDGQAKPVVPTKEPTPIKPVPTAPPTPPAAPAYVVDTLVAPNDNPWKARMRFSGVDFFPDGKSAAVCTWDGDVWLVSNLDEKLDHLSWRRIATGLHQPLGLKIVTAGGAGGAGAAEGGARGNGTSAIYVSCRDQIARLHDLNGDGEIDFIECFNGDHQVTEHFHEFAMGLDTDAEGNFYYAKGARHALPAVVAQHGTVIRVSKDGRRSEIICTGLRASNGMGVSPRGEVAISDQEGYWMPANRINLFTPSAAGAGVAGGMPFMGNIWGYMRPERTAEQGYDPPLCWMPVNLDRSPAEEFWAPADRFGPLSGQMLHTSYGTGRVLEVMYEKVDGVVQGGVLEIPGLAFPTGIMRGRFNPADGSLFVCGLVGWSTNTSDPGGLFRVRYTGKPAHLPTGLHIRKDAIGIEFSDPLDKASARDVGSYAIQQWGYRWTQFYGSKHYKVSDPSKQGQDEVEVSAAAISEDGRTITLTIPGLKPVMQMKIELDLKAADGSPVKRVIHNTINRVPG